MSRVRELNDAFRSTFEGGRVLITAGVSALPPILAAEVLERVRTFDAFSPDNNPHGHRDFGSFKPTAASGFFWKIDLYEAPSVKAADGAPVVTRVLTIMLAGRVLTLKLDAGPTALWGLFFWDRSCSGRGHALRRIDLYPVEGLCPRTATTAIHVDRSRVARAVTTLLLGSGEPSIFSGRRPSHRRRGELESRPQAFKVAPSGTTPCAMKRQSAMASFRAKATIPTLRPRMPVLPKRSCHHRESSLCGW